MSLREVLARAAEYAVSYGAALESVIADEDFVQQVLRDGRPVEERRLQSEIAYVTLPGAQEWLAFRHVLRVDGLPIPDAAGALERIFRSTPSSARARARALAAAGARYHLGPVQRNFNLPTTVLQFLLPQHQERFRFRRAAEERHEGSPVWVVAFEERDRATFIRTPAGEPAPAAGRAWIAPEDGRVLRTELTVAAPVAAQVETVWTQDVRLDMLVPDEMRESYRAGRGRAGQPSLGEGDEITGAARYSNYRRFEVEVRIGR